MSAGASICWVAINGVLAGYLALADSPRPEAAAAVRQLQGQKMVTAMLTGDSSGAADAVANAVGLQQEHVHASLLPQDKFDLVSISCIVQTCCVRFTKQGGLCIFKILSLLWMALAS